jgi:hypothetical protein
MVEDIESDLSVFHRVDDLAGISVCRFFRLVTRLSAYGGVMTSRFAAPAPAAPVAAPERLAADLPVPARDVTPENADALLNNEMYGALPGIGPVFSHSYAPLSEEG